MVLNKGLPFTLSYGTFLSISDFLLIIFGFQITLISIVNDSNSDIRSDINFHFHYGMTFAGITLFLAAVIGFTGVFEETLRRLTFSSALMLSSIFILLQSVCLGVAYNEELSLLNNSYQEIAFRNHIQNRSQSTFRDQTYLVMKAFKCCGWKRAEDLRINDDVLPCICCKLSLNGYRKCEDSLSRLTTNSSFICKMDSKYRISETCEPLVAQTFKNDMKWMNTWMIIAIFLSIGSLFFKTKIFIKICYQTIG